jgi:hypothetical protein
VVWNLFTCHTVSSLVFLSIVSIFTAHNCPIVFLCYCLSFISVKQASLSLKVIPIQLLKIFGRIHWWTQTLLAWPFSGSCCFFVCLFVCFLTTNSIYLIFVVVVRISTSFWISFDYFCLSIICPFQRLSNLLVCNCSWNFHILIYF